MKSANEKFIRDLLRVRAYGWYLASVSVLILGFWLSARTYPGGFDWRYRVASALASHLDNPAGSDWSAIGLGLAMLLMWPYVSAARKRMEAGATTWTRVAFRVLRFGLAFGMLVGLERLLIRDLSTDVPKGHEILALLAFFGLDIGVFMLLAQAIVRRRLYAVPALLILLPLIAVAFNQFWLYLAQRNIGWVHTDWKRLGIPLWFSFAFWQWQAITFVMLGLGLLGFIAGEDREH